MIVFWVYKSLVYLFISILQAIAVVSADPRSLADYVTLNLKSRNANVLFTVVQHSELYYEYHEL